MYWTIGPPGDPQDLHDRQAFFRRRFVHGRRLVEPAPQQVAGDRRNDAEQERNPPSPLLHLRIGQDRGRKRADTGGGRHSHIGAEQRPARNEGAPVARRVFNQENRRDGVFAGNAKALAQSQDHQQDGRGDADFVISGQQADQKGAGAHRCQRDDHHRRAPERVRQASQNQPADGSGEITDGEDPEGRQAATPGDRPTGRNACRWRLQKNRKYRSRTTRGNCPFPQPRSSAEGFFSSSPPVAYASRN